MGRHKFLITLKMTTIGTLTFNVPMLYLMHWLNKDFDLIIYIYIWIYNVVKFPKRTRAFYSIYSGNFSSTKMYNCLIYVYRLS